MSRYIDAELSQKIADAELDLEQAGIVQYVLSHTPTIDPENLRPKGKWLRDGNFLICLNCESEINEKNSLGEENKRNYCPCCGAKMEG